MKSSKKRQDDSELKKLALPAFAGSKYPMKTPRLVRVLILEPRLGPPSIFVYATNATLTSLEEDEAFMTAADLKEKTTKE